MKGHTYSKRRPWGFAEFESNAQFRPQLSAIAKRAACWSAVGRIPLTVAPIKLTKLKARRSSDRVSDMYYRIG